MKIGAAFKNTLRPCHWPFFVRSPAVHPRLRAGKRELPRGYRLRQPRAGRLSSATSKHVDDFGLECSDCHTKIFEMKAYAARENGDFNMDALRRREILRQVP